MKIQAPPEKTLNQIVGENVRRARKQAGLSQAQLAAALGCQQPLISRIETGMISATLEVLVAIGRATDRSPALLLPIDDEAIARTVSAAWRDSADNARILIQSGLDMLDRVLGPAAEPLIAASAPPGPAAPPDDDD